MTVSDELRKVIRESGVTHYRIGKDTGVNIRTIDRFVGDGKPTHTDTFDVLCDYFSLKLTEKKRQTSAKPPGKKSAKRAQVSQGRGGMSGVKKPPPP